jgi:hypothetical protein
MAASATQTYGEAMTNDRVMTGNFMYRPGSQGEESLEVSWLI